jgi:hypothetical protein
MKSKRVEGTVNPCGDHRNEFSIILPGELIVMEATLLQFAHKIQRSLRQRTDRAQQPLLSPARQSPPRFISMG